MPALILYRHGYALLHFPLPTDGPIRIGRHPSNELSLPDEAVSRFHALIAPREGRYWLEDQSRNGTFVNGDRIRSSVLKDQDEIHLGDWKVVFQDEAAWAEQETAVLQKRKSPPQFFGMVGQSNGLQKVRSMIEKAAPTMATVLVVGETGAGKELVARAIHNLSPRERKPFIAINCGAISPQLIESELFGHERGAFTGAVQTHRGAFDQARGGTLFLDEIGELPMELQPKLLRVLEDRKFRRVGGVEELEADVRIVAATHRNLERLCGDGKFREDLYFRLHTVPIPLPPLRERSEDIPELTEHFIGLLQSGIEEDRKRSLSPEAQARLTDYPWRGNIRELKNVITRSLLFSKDPILGSEDILFLSAGSPTAKISLEDTEKDAIMTCLRRNHGNKKKTADALGIAKSTLFHKIKEYGIKIGE